MDAIVAVYSDWGIGSEGTQPIVVPEDRRHFAKLTSGSTVIVGRRTMEDFPGGKPLKDRVNLVITRQDSDIEGAQVVHTLQEAIDASQNAEKVFVLGGASIYMAMFPYIDRIYVTKIGATPKSDAYFPNLDSLPDWKCVEVSPSPPASTSAASAPTSGWTETHKKLPSGIPEREFLLLLRGLYSAGMAPTMRLSYISWVRSHW